MELERGSRTILAILSLVLIVLILDGLFTGFMISFAGTRYVNRNILQENVEPNDQVTVTLDVGVLAGDRFYFIDEIVPNGWTVVDDGGLNYGWEDPSVCNDEIPPDCGDGKWHLKIAFVNETGNEISDRTYTYIIKAPGSDGVYTLAGTYQIDGMSSFLPITGETTVTVETQPQPETCNGIDDDLDSIIDNGCDDDDDDYCDASMIRDVAYSCSGTTQCCPIGANDCDDTNPYINPGSNVYCDCNAETGGRYTTGTTEVCGDSIDQDCDGSDLPCCTLIFSAWNESQVKEGKAVRLSVNSSNCPNGDVVQLYLWETDGASSELVTSIDLGSMSLLNNYASKLWITVWTRDTGDMDSDPEYLFESRLRSNTSDTDSSDVLRVTSDDEDKDGVHDDFDCNDNNINIGECTGCAVCSDPTGYSGTCIGGTSCTFYAICQELCGYDRGSLVCGDDEMPQFSSPTEPSVCEVTGDDGVCRTDCVDYTCLYDSDCDLDDDNDGVPDINDLCPQTLPEYVGIVNVYGCPKPIATEFTPDLTTNFQLANLFNITNMTLGVTGIDRVKFIGETRIVQYDGLSYIPVNLDSNILMAVARVLIDGNVLAMLDKLSTITNYALEIPAPIVWKDGEICQDCIVINPLDYMGSPGNPDNLQFWVSGFTDYVVNGSECGDNYCYSGPPEFEDCADCPQDCGDCPLPCTDDDFDYWVLEAEPDSDCCGPLWSEVCTGGGDCNDSSDEINPGILEIPYNGIDDDCNALTRDTDLDGDGNLPLLEGGTDCNDNNHNIGQCEGCAVCSDPIGISGVCQADDAGCEPIQCPSEPECGFGGCNATSIAVFQYAAEPASCSVAGDEGTCGPDECESYDCEYLTDCEIDTDNDGVADISDYCPNTAPEELNIINRYGCPIPVSSIFTPDLTTNFSNVNLLDVKNLTLGITGMGQIRFLGNTSILEYSSTEDRYVSVNLNDNVNISRNFVSVNSTALPMLNKLSSVKLFNLTLVRPVILRNGLLCGSSCQVIQYLGSAYKNLTFSVASFTSYSSTEHFCGDGSCDSDLDESCSNCPGDCGDCPTDDDTPPPGGGGVTEPSCQNTPIQPCPTAVWLSYPVCSWDTSQCLGASTNCTLGAKRCLGSYLQECQVNASVSDTPRWINLRMCQYGCNVQDLVCRPYALIECNESWECTAWSNCTNDRQTRLCFDRGQCGTFNDKPPEVSTCLLPPPPLPEILFFPPSFDYLAVVVVSIGVIIFLIMVVILEMRKQKAENLGIVEPV